MWRAGAIAAFALAGASCEKRQPAPQVQRTVDVCDLVAERDASSVVGEPAVRKRLGPGECGWEGGRWSLRVAVTELGALKTPVIVVTRNEITHNGKTVHIGPTTEQLPLGEAGWIESSETDGVTIRWRQHGMFVELQLTSTGPSAPTAKIEPMKQLARALERKLATP